MSRPHFGRLKGKASSKSNSSTSSVGKKTSQATISRFFSPKATKACDTNKDADAKKNKSYLVVSSPYGKRLHPTDAEKGDDPLQRRPTKQLKLDDSTHEEPIHSTDSQSTHVSLSVGTLEKLNTFSLASAKVNPDICDSGKSTAPCNFHQKPHANTKTHPGQDNEPVDNSGSDDFQSVSPGNGTRSGHCVSRPSGSNETQSRKPSKLSELKGKFNFDSGSSTSASPKVSAPAKNGGDRGKGKLPRTKSQYTPLEQQFMRIKENYKDAVLFVECGYKYRFFGEDAEIAAKHLNIFCHLDHNFMTASIPTHRLFVHVRRLVAKGYKVGVVKQMETAALKAAGDTKGQPFERKLSALYTKSTLIGEDLEPSNHDGEDPSSFSSSPTSYLLCLCEFVKEGARSSRSDTTELGLVAVQPATGDIVYDSFYDNDHLGELDTRLHHIQPVELLLPESLSPRTEKLLKDIRMSSDSEDCIRVERLPNEVYEYGAAFEEVSSFYTSHGGATSGQSSSESTPMLQLILSLPKPVVCCLAALLKYLKEFHLHRILQVTSNMTHFSSSRQALKLDACALRNLEVFQNQVDGSERGTLLWVLNHTQTRFGKRQLIKWLSQPLVNIIDVESRLEAVAEILEADSLPLKNVINVLARTPDLDRGLCSIYHKKCSAAEFVTVVRSLTKLKLTTKALEGAADIKSSLLRSIFSEVPHLLEDIDSFLAAINEKAVREGNKTNLFTDPSQFPAVHQCMTDIAEVTDLLGEHRRTLRKQIALPSAEYITVSGNEYMIEVKNTQLKKVPKDWIPVSSTKQVTRFRPPYVEASFKRLCQLREQLALECQNAWLQFLESFGEKYFSYRKAVQHLASFDCLLSLATVSKQDGYCRPEVHDGPSVIEIKGGRHPVVSTLKVDGEQYVPNDTSIRVDGMRCMIITGPNMGGKSSYIKQVALISLMAQVGCYVPAESARIGALDAIYTRMGASDDIFRNRSTFMSELQEASDIMAKASPRSLVIMDELGRGTSTHDGVAIAYATAMHLISQVKCLTLFVTHYPPLAELQRLYPAQAGNFHMSFLLQDAQDEESGLERLTFLYQLVDGVAARSYGLNVARLATIPETILDQAATKSCELEDAVVKKRSAKEIFVQLWEASSSSTTPTMLKRIRQMFGSIE